MKSLGKFPDPFIAEIASQPDALRRAGAAALRQTASILSAAIPGRSGNLVLAGMGSSYDACYPAATSLAADGVPALMLDAAELLHFRLGILGADDLLMLVSQSGESAETVKVARVLRDRGDAPTMVSITNGTENALASLADIALDTDAGVETGPSTMTFVASLVLVGALARAIALSDAPVRSIAEAADTTADAVARLVARETLADELAGWHGGRATTVTMGRGAARAAAEMGALTLKEAVGIPVESFETAQFRHGPLELVGPDLAAIVVATEAATRALDEGLAAELVRLGAAVLVISPDGAAPNGATGLAIGPADPLLSPAVAIVPVQLLAWRLARAAGRAPGAYVHAAKVTSRE